MKKYLDSVSKTIAFLFSWLVVGTGYAQLFPGLDGQSLIQAIRDEYTPVHLLNDTQVKDTLYAKVFIEGDTVRCIYSGLPRSLPQGVDPSQWLYGSGLEVESINLEHGWPQAKGADKGTNGNMDMHHLFPSRSAINSDRANFPFSEIDDDQTQKWYYLDEVLTTVPVAHINEYSEFAAGKFEPHESVKGDIARAMFYFWTIYHDDALAADPLFFDIQREDLCQWHESDPASEFEELRNERIANYQDGKKNPFILDCSLAKRTYCSEIPDCEIVKTHEKEHEEYLLHFDPSLQKFVIAGPGSGLWKLTVVNMVGHVFYQGALETNVPSDLISLSTGIYFAFAINERSKVSSKFYIPY